MTNRPETVKVATLLALRRIAGGYSLKEANIITPLQEHQRHALARARANNIVLAHSTGSGKTLTAIAVADALNKPTTVLTPASLVENFKKELAKHKKGGPPVDVQSLPTAVSRGYQVPKGSTLIVDEAHSLRNADTARTKYVTEQARRAGRVIALTGTPAYNKLENWAPLVNMLSDRPVVPESPAEFSAKFLDDHKVPVSFFQRLRGYKPGSVLKLKKGDVLAKTLAPYVDIFDTDVEKPQRIEEFVHVPMDPDQLEVYRAVEGSIPAGIRYKLRKNLPPSKSEAKSLNSFYGGVRQISNTPWPFSTTYQQPGSKLRTAAANLIDEYKKNPSFRALVYSNYLDAGVRTYAELLEEAGVPFAVFDGSLSANKKRAIVDGYNNGTIPVILGTGSASEGLDLQGTSMVQVLEPHFNNSRLEQVIGRGIRYKSHAHLPPEQRKVLVQRYISTIPPKRSLLSRLFGTTPTQDSSVDQYLRHRAEEKDELAQDVKESLVRILRERDSRRS